MVDAIAVTFVAKENELQPDRAFSGLIQKHFDFCHEDQLNQ